jgi:hypothetical protein
MKINNCYKIINEINKINLAIEADKKTTNSLMKLLIDNFNHIFEINYDFIEVYLSIYFCLYYKIFILKESFENISSEKNYIYINIIKNIIDCEEKIKEISKSIYSGIITDVKFIDFELESV